MSGNDMDCSVVWQYGPSEQQHIRDANRADDRPDGLTFDVEGGEIIATGDAESIRWLYDYLHYLKRAWRNEGEQFDADAAEEMAESLYEQLDGDLPERQRNKKAMTDGGRADGMERTGYAYTKLQLTNPVDAHGPVVDVQTWFEPFGLRLEGKIATEPEDERYV